MTGETDISPEGRPAVPPPAPTDTPAPPPPPAARIAAPAVHTPREVDNTGDYVDTNDPDFRKDMSPEDEKRTGHDGRPAVLGKPWSLAGTGLWLCIGCVQPPVGEGRPKVPMDGFWNALELPSDLASDPLKKAYLTQWIVDEVDKACGQAGL